MSEAGFAEATATILTAFAFCFIRLVFSSGESRLAKGALQDFTETVTTISTFRKEAAAAIDRRPLVAKALIALAYGFAFFITHAIIRWGLEIFANPWIAGAVGLLFAAIVTSPALFSSLFATFTSSNKEAPDGE